MELTITDVDYAPPELNEQVPFKIKLLHMLPGQDRPDYWLGKLLKPLVWLKDNHCIQVEYVVVCARWQGTQIELSVQHLPVGIAYVTDHSQVTADTLDFAKCHYVAIGLAHETSTQRAPTGPTPIQAGTIGGAFSKGIVPYNRWLSILPLSRITLA
jgi:hypothetical protein